jgi:hypothetical protein
LVVDSTVREEIEVFAPRELRVKRSPVGEWYVSTWQAVLRRARARVEDRG